MPQSHANKAGEKKTTEAHCEPEATRMADGPFYVYFYYRFLSHSDYKIIITYMHRQTQTHVSTLTADSTLLPPSMLACTRTITARGPENILSKNSRGEEKKENISLHRTWKHIPGDHINPHNHIKWLPPLNTKNIHLYSVTGRWWELRDNRSFTNG